MKEFIATCADSMAICLIIQTVLSNWKHIAQELGLPSWKGSKV